MPKKNQPCCQSYLIGVDGGGTKTVAVLADLNGKILATAKAGPSNPRNIGVEAAAANIAEAIAKVVKAAKGKKIISTFIGLAAVEEGFGIKKETIKKEILKHQQAAKISKGKLIIGSDQLVAFCSASKKKDGVVLIAGTGCVSHGWKGKKEAKAAGWGWLNDEGSAFWAGQKIFQAVFKELDGRCPVRPTTLLAKLVLKTLKVKTKTELLAKVYSGNSGNTMAMVSSLSICGDKASIANDKIAKKIMADAGKELALATKTVIKKLGFQKQKFPLVLVGGMFKSKIVLATVKKEIKKVAPRVKFILQKEEPAIGAINLAREEIENRDEDIKSQSKKL